MGVHLRKGRRRQRFKMRCSTDWATQARSPDERRLRPLRPGATPVQRRCQPRRSNWSFEKRRERTRLWDLKESVLVETTLGREATVDLLHVVDQFGSCTREQLLEVVRLAEHVRVS